MIIINENEYAQDRIKNKNIGDNIYQTLTILAKYYHSQGMKHKAVCIELKNFLDLAYPKYSMNKSYWSDIIEKISKKTTKEKLFESDGVWITEAEWNEIEKLNNKVLEKLAFTLLCIAKINNQKKPNNNNWVNTEIKEIFKMANISCSIDLRAKRLGVIIHSGLAEFAKRIDNLNLKILFVHDEDKKKFIVNDFRNLGNEYLYRIGENYIRCAECGTLVKNNKFGNKKYCSTCASYIPQNLKQIECVDCGKIIYISALNNKTCRCLDCQKENDKRRKREWKNRNSKK